VAPSLTRPERPQPLAPTRRRSLASAGTVSGPRSTATVRCGPPSGGVFPGAL